MPICQFEQKLLRDSVDIKKQTWRRRVRGWGTAGEGRNRARRSISRPPRASGLFLPRALNNSIFLYYLRRHVKP